MKSLSTKMHKLYASTLSLLLAFPLISASLPAAAAVAACGTGGTPAVTFLSDPVFTMSTSDAYDGNYIGYKVTPSSNVSDLWVGLSNFTGGVVNLAANQSPYQSNGPVNAGTSINTYFLAAGATPTTATQTHTVTVYNGNPNAGTAIPLCSATNSFTRVEDTITANSNKVNSITTSSSTGTLGASIDVTVMGDTGTIGSGPAYDLGVINFAPTAKSDFPANAWRLAKVVMNDTTNGRTWTDVLHLNNMSGAAWAYTATYTFVAVGTTNVSGTIIPIQYIASGTQVKHTGGMPASLPTLPVVTNNLTTTKTANLAQLPYTGGDVEYTVTVGNTGAATSLDQIVDELPANSTYKTGSATINGASVADPTMTNGVATFIGPYNIAQASSLVLKYTLTYGANTGTYTNSAVAYVSSTMIDGTLSTADDAPASASIFVLPYPPNVEPASSTTAGPGSYTFTPTSSNPGSSINPALTCVIDPATEACVKTLTTDEGTWTVEPDGDINFTPNPTFIGESTVEYLVSDDYNQADTSTLTVDITLPTAPAVTATVKELYGWNPDNVTVTYTGTGITPTPTCIQVDATCVKTYTVDTEGTWTIENDGTVTFDPLFGYRGTTTPITYQVTDQYGQQGSNTVTYIVTAPEEPLGSPLSGTTNFDTNISFIPTTSNAIEMDYTTVCLIDPAYGVCQKNVTIENEGTWTVDTVTGTITFNPERGFVGNATPLTYKFRDTYGQETSSTVEATVLPPVGPTLEDKNLPTTYHTPSSGQMTVTEGDGTIYSYCIIDGTDCFQQKVVPGEGTWTVNSTGTLTFDPERYFTGNPTDVTIKVTDEWGSTDTALGTANVANPNAPIGDHKAGIVASWMTSTTIIPDVTGELIDWTSFCIIDPSDNICKKTFSIENVGTFDVNLTTGETTFTPVAGFNGTTPEITYEVKDGWNQTATNTLVFSAGLPDAPTIDPYSETIQYGTSTTFTPTITSTTAMDAEYCIVDGSSCVTTKVITEGTFTVNATTGEVVFTPASKFFGNVPQQTFRGQNVFGQTTTATINITVNTPALPTLQPELPATTPYNTPKTFNLNATPGGGDITTFCITTSTGCEQSLTIDGEGTWTVNDNGTLTFTPEEGFAGEATPIEVSVVDEFGNTDSTNINVEILMPATPTVNPLTDTITWGTQSSTIPSFVGENVDMSATCIIDPADNACKLSVTIAGEGTYSYNKYTNYITFTPENNFTGNATPVNYRMSDMWGRNATNTLTITVTAPGAPTTTPYSNSVSFEGELTFTPATTATTPNSTYCLLDGATCVTILSVNGGTFTMNPNTGETVFTAAPGFSGVIPTVQYKITDQTGQSSTNSIDITVDERIVTPPPADPEYASVNGIVWLDLNHNNIKDETEPLLRNVPVTLTLNPNAGTVSFAQAGLSLNVAAVSTYTAYTDNNGYYKFSSIVPGSYTLSAQLTTDRLDPSWDTNGGLDWTVPLVLVANETSVADFATAGTASMQGKVVFENNEVIPNAHVACVWEGLDTTLGTEDDITFTFTTDAEGNFLAEGIPGGAFVCQGQDPNSDKVSSALSVSVDQESATPAEATLVVPVEAPAPAENKTTPATLTTTQLAYTGNRIGEVSFFAGAITLLGMAFLFYGSRTPRRQPKHKL